MKASLTSKKKASDGFVLPLITVLGFILAIGGMTLIARSLGGLMGSIRQQHSRSAREAAETGIAITLESLNRQYSYLLINCYARNISTLTGSSPPTKNSCSNTGTWSSPSLPSAICKGSRSPGISFPELRGITADPNTRYRIEHYAFNGTSFYGGTGSLKIIGERLSNDNSQVLATSAIQQEFNVNPKPCPVGSGFPGLLALQHMNLGGNDVRGVTSGNVFCVSCTVEDPSLSDGTFTQSELEAAVGASSGSDIDGQIYIGELHVPDAKTFPDGSSDEDGETTKNLKQFVTAKTIDTSLTITASSIQTTSTATTSNGNMCATDASSPPITHCLISAINLNGKEVLKVDSTAGPVRLYISGDVNAGGATGISHIWSTEGDPPAARLSLFGNPKSSDDDCESDPSYTNQTVTLAGTSKPAKAANLFAYFPCAETGINGGGGEDPICDEAGECGGGDISGAIWTKNWGMSNSNVAELTVPANMASQLLEYFGTDYAISVRRYVAQGVKDWRGFQGLSQ